MSFSRTGKIPGKISRTTSCQLMFSWYKVEFSAKNFSRSKISIIPGIWRHFQELAKFLEKFLERPPVNLCSPNTKSNFRPKFLFLGPLKNSGKNSSNDLLSTYVLLIQSQIFGQNFYSLVPWKSLRKIPRTTSYQLMFS